MLNHHEEVLASLPKGVIERVQGIRERLTRMGIGRPKFEINDRTHRQAREGNKGNGDDSHAVHLVMPPR